MEDEFVKDLAAVINKHSMENLSNTPDFILAQYLQSCLQAYGWAVRKRDDWGSDDFGNTARAALAQKEPVE